MQRYDTNGRMCKTCEREKCQIGTCRTALTPDGTIPHMPSSASNPPLACG